MAVKTLRQRPRCCRLLFVTFAALAACFLLLSSRAASAQVSEAEANELARKAVLADLGHSEDSFLAVSSVPMFQQLFAQVVTEGHDPLPFVFHISNEGEEHLGNLTKYHLPSDFILDALVAVSVSGEVYRIREGHNSLGEYNRLASDYRVGLRSEGQVRNYLAWFLAVNPENYLALEKIGSVQQLKAEAERKFKGWRSSPDADEAAFDAWWRKHEQQASRLAYEEQVKRSDRGFVVSFYGLSVMDRRHLRCGLGVVRLSVEFSTNGEAGSVSVKMAD